jgi:hypothetical protein
VARIKSLAALLQAASADSNNLSGVREIAEQIGEQAARVKELAPG